MQYEPMDTRTEARQVCWLPVERITPRPSVSTEPADGMTLMELTESIRMHGMIQPVTVRPDGEGRYTIISGNRRLMACRLAGLTHVDAVVLGGVQEDAAVRPVLECILSGRLHYLDEADAIKRLADQGLSRDELARSLGCTVAHVQQRIRLAGLDEETKRFLLEYGLPEGHARALVKLPDRRARMTIARQAVRDRLCIRDVELLVASAQSRLPVPPLPGGRTINLVRDHRLYLNAIRSIVAQMQEAGLNATTHERNLDDSIEVTLRLPKHFRRAGRAAQ